MFRIYPSQQQSINREVLPQQLSSISSLRPLVKTSVPRTNQIAYSTFRNIKSQTDLCYLPFPYVHQTKLTTIQPDKKQTKTVIKIQNKLRKQKTKQADFLKSFKQQNYETQQAPINEYLNYEMSEQINLGIKNARKLADEIKHIRQMKILERTAGNSLKEREFDLLNPTNKNIRIKVFHGFSKNYKGIYTNSNQVIREKIR